MVFDRSVFMIAQASESNVTLFAKQLDDARATLSAVNTLDSMRF
jgi:hypothetical protein